MKRALNVASNVDARFLNVRSILTFHIQFLDGNSHINFPHWVSVVIWWFSSIRKEHSLVKGKMLESDMEGIRKDEEKRHKGKKEKHKKKLSKNYTITWIALWRINSFIFPSSSAIFHPLSFFLSHYFLCHKKAQLKWKIN